MNDSMDQEPNILNELRGLNRKRLYEVWHNAKDNNMDHLSEEEQEIGKCMLEHEEYHNQFEIADLLSDHDFDPEKGINPFLHITFHVLVENQLKSREPIEVYQFYNSMRKKKVSHHDSIHLVGCILIPVLFQALKQNIPFDNDFYMHQLKKFKGKNPEKIYSALGY